MALGPHTKAILGWVIVTTGALTAFYYSRQSINQKRYNRMVEERRLIKEEKEAAKKTADSS